MRESNFAFPGQNRACVCITSQLYDRRALDTLSALPLFNSLTHLAYLTSTSPRIREIMTMDGGLERLVRILHDFCMSPPPPENPALLYGLSPPSARPPRLAPTLNPQSFDKHAAFRFSLAFQCVVNIGVRGSEPIRSRVVQAGTLDVVGCILEAWLANKGFAVGPSSSATGMPRETREQRLARRQAQRNRDEAAELARALERQIQVENYLRLERAAIRVQDDESTDARSSSSRTTDLSLLPASSSTSHTQTRHSPSPDADTSTSAETSTAATPIGSNTPTGTVVVPGRDRSGTVIGRPVWDPPPTATRHRTPRNHHHHRPSPPTSASPSPSTDNSRPETETEDDGDGDVDMDRSVRRDTDDGSPSPTSRAAHLLMQRPRRAVGIVSDTPAAIPLQVNTDAHIIINDAQGDVGGEGGMGVEDGIVLLEANDDFAMGAPPGAPGAIPIDEGTTPRNMNLRTIGEGERQRNRPAPDVTPRAGTMSLPPAIPDAHGRGMVPRDNGTMQRAGTIRGRTGAHVATNEVTNATAALSPGLGLTMNRTSSTHHRSADTGDSGPYRDEDVLLSLQLLAYLSKYPHVRQAFYKPRVTFHPASVNLGTRAVPGKGNAKAGATSAASESSRQPSSLSLSFAKESHGFFRAFAGRGKEKEKEKVSAGASSSSSTLPSSSSSSMPPLPPTPTRQTNVFSLVERFTFRPSSTETDLPNPPPKLPPEIQYWAGVIMRNACRKDESRGGIRQCANMLCGRWESYPREFAKCRRCRKAKYCGKECQSTAWSEGHRFWCSAKDGDDDVTEQVAGDPPSSAIEVTSAVDDDNPGITITSGGTVTGRTERRAERERERNVRALANMASGESAQVARAAANAFRSALDNARVAVGVNPHSIFPVPPPTNAPGSSGTGNGTQHTALRGHYERGNGVGGVTSTAAAGHHTPRHQIYDPYLAMHSATFMDQGGRRRAETVAGLTSVMTVDMSADRAQQARLRPNRPEMYHPQQYLDGNHRGPGTDRTDAGPSRSRRRGDNSFRAAGSEHDMVLG